MIVALLSRHHADAAWYSTQLDADRASTLVDVDRLRHYQRVFMAHLDGLRFGGESSVTIALEQLQRWKGHGELFVCWYLAYALRHQQLASAAWSFLAAHPQPHFIDAAATALLWLPADRTEYVCSQLMASDDPLGLCVALNAYGLRREAPSLDLGRNLAKDLGKALSPLFRHASPDVRAEVCRYAGRMRVHDLLSLVLAALDDASPEVREQAAVALLVNNHPQAALQELYAATLRHAATADAGKGATAIRSERRAQHLARLLGHALPFPCDSATLCTLTTQLPPYLHILTLAHHGNPQYIDLLIAQMHDNAQGAALGAAPYKRRALWAMCCILGINPEAENLLSAAPSLSADWPRAPGLDQDTGLPEPDADAARCWWNAHQASFPPAPVSYLMGRTMDTAEATMPLMRDGMQVQRFAAALHRLRLQPDAVWMDTRAPIAMQRCWLA